MMQAKPLDMREGERASVSKWYERHVNLQEK
jgi:hypothetical protein